MNCETCGQEYPIDEKTFGGRLRMLRIKAGMTTRELGQAVGYKSSGQITRLEQGTAPMPDSVKLIGDLADATSGEFLYLMSGIDVKSGVQEPLPLREPEVGVDWSGPVDRANRPTMYTDGSEIPIGLRPNEPPEGVVVKKG